MLARAPFDGPLTLQVGDTDRSWGRRSAQQVLVEEAPGRGVSGSRVRNRPTVPARVWRGTNVAAGSLPTCHVRPPVPSATHRASITAVYRVRLLACLIAAPLTLGAQAATDTVLGTPSEPPVPGRQAPEVRGIALDERLAADYGVAVGDTVRLSAEAGTVGERVYIAAVTRRAADPSEVARSEYRVRLHLDQLQRLTGSDDRVDRFAVGLQPDAGANALDARSPASTTWPSGFAHTPPRDVAVESSRTFQVVERFHRAIGGITIVASAVFLLCILLLKVEERRRAIAALRLAGLSRRTVALSVIAEAAMVAVVGSAVGAVLGWVVTMAVNWYYQRRLSHAAHLRRAHAGHRGSSPWRCRCVLGVVAGALAAWRLVRTPPLVLLGR